MKKWLAAVLILGIGSSMALTTYAGTWQEEAGEWRYQTEDGGYAADQWVKEGDQWYYLDENGCMRTDGWVNQHDGRYYVDENGVMLSSVSREIDGISYSFAEDGRAVMNRRIPVEPGPGVEPGSDGITPGGVWSGRTYINGDKDYMITIPEGYLLDGVLASQFNEDCSADFIVQSPDGAVLFGVLSYNKQITFVWSQGEVEGPVESAAEMAEGMQRVFVEYNGFQKNGEITQVSIGGYDYVKVPVKYEDIFCTDLYFRWIEEDGVMMLINVSYDFGREGEAAALLSLMQKAGEERIEGGRDE